MENIKKRETEINTLNTKIENGKESKDGQLYIIQPNGRIFSVLGIEK